MFDHLLRIMIKDIVYLLFSFCQLCWSQGSELGDRGAIARGSQASPAGLLLLDPRLLDLPA